MRNLTLENWPNPVDCGGLVTANPEQFQAGANRRQWIAQLVGEYGEEGVLTSIRLPQCLFSTLSLGDIDGCAHIADKRTVLDSRCGVRTHPAPVAIRPTKPELR